MTIEVSSIIVFFLGILLKFIAVSLSHDGGDYKGGYVLTAATTALVFMLFCNLAASNSRWYLILFLTICFILGAANKHIFSSRFGGYIVASYIGIWLSTPYAVYVFLRRIQLRSA